MNRFSVYDREEKTVLGLVKNLATQMDNYKFVDANAEIVDARIGEPTLFHKIQKIDNIIDKFHISEVNVLDLGLKGDGTEEDLSQLKLFLSDKITNIRLVFPSNKVFKINETIKIKADNCILDFNGIIICDTDCINLMDVNESIVNINVIKKSSDLNLWYDWNNGKTLDYSTFTSYGLSLNNVRNCQFNIGRIQGYKYGIWLHPTTFELNDSVTFSGIQYNIFNLGSIYGNNNCITFQHGGNNTWANSNTFNVGMLSGGVGIHMVKSVYENTDAFNQNNFYGTGFEYCKTGGILIEEGKDNSFNNFRFDKTDNYYIKCSEGTERLSFITNYQIFFEGCELFGKGHYIKAPIYKYSDISKPVAEKMNFLTPYTKVSENLVMSDISENSTETYVLKETDKPLAYNYKFVKDAWGKIRPIAPFPSFNKTSGTSSGTVKEITLTNMNDIHYPDTRQGNVIYKFTAEVESVYIGQVIKIFTTGNTEPDRVSFQNSNGTVINLPSLAYNKMYFLINIGGEFKLIEMGTNLN